MFTIPVRCTTKAGTLTTRRFRGRKLGPLGELILPNGPARERDFAPAEIRVIP